MLGDMLADAINCVGFTWVRGRLHMHLYCFFCLHSEACTWHSDRKYISYFPRFVENLRASIWTGSLEVILQEKSDYFQYMYATQNILDRDHYYYPCVQNVEKNIEQIMNKQKP